MNMLPTITDSAKKHLIKMAERSNAANIHFGVKGGGCAGFKYDWSTIETDKINPKDEIVKLNEDKTLVIDSYSIFYLMGCTIDYKEDFAGSQIVIENPQATSSCGCGESVGF